ncbi:unnamed protein product [Pleuronectes platessa]|uniref:Uncharacterized protein n=1 Tax=Pleuronectes platessa TaxID=8262 RepID=A0A9N7Y1M9_PLEPL|nr:unnamed protein product [Pleuronectes platessa]
MKQRDGRQGDGQEDPERREMSGQSWTCPCKVLSRAPRQRSGGQRGPRLSAYVSMTQILGTGSIYSSVLPQQPCDKSGLIFTSVSGEMSHRRQKDPKPLICFKETGNTKSHDRRVL